jgi:hypothetical protein
MKMTETEFKSKIGKFRSQNHKLINDTFIWVEVALNALKKAEIDEDFISSQKFDVPSKRREKKINRTTTQIKSIVKTAHEKDLLYSIFTYIVAQFEGFLNDLIKTCLEYDNRRIKTNIQGINHLKKLDVSEIIDAENKGNLIQLIIEKELNSIFYASPQKQREYLEKVLGVEVDDELWSSWKEYKATRDIIVHNQGKVNRIYQEKSGDKARGEIGKRIPLELDYFKNTMADIKSLIGRISNTIQKELKKENSK